VQHPVDDFDALTARVNSGGAPSGKHNEDYPISLYMIAPHQGTEH
jgi:hypothetical protein